MTEAAADLPPLFTIGHSTLSVEALAEQLQGAGVTQLVDVRSFPHSRTNPQFNRERMPAALKPYGIAYQHMAALGGRRNLQKGVPPSTNGFWDNRSFHNYADYALQPAFQAALAELMEHARNQRCAFMCSEAVWWRCHRRIIADHLLARGRSVRHIIDGKIEDAQLTRGAHVDASGMVTYPSPTPELWDPPATEKPDTNA